MRNKTELAGVMLCTLAVMLIPSRLLSSPREVSSGSQVGAASQTSNDSRLDLLLALKRAELFEIGSALGHAEWHKLSPRILLRFGAAKPGSIERKRLLDVAAQAPSRLALSMGNTLWAKDPGCFDLDQQMAFAAHGVGSCEAALADYVAEGQRSLLLQDIGPAIFLALRGDDAGMRILQRAWDWTDLEAGGAGKALLVAFALEQLDSKGALSEMRLLIAQGVQMAQNEGSFDLARSLALEVQAFDLMLGSSCDGIELSELAWFGEKLGRHCQERGIEEKSPGTCFDSDQTCQADVGAPFLPRGARPI